MRCLKEDPGVRYLVIGLVLSTMAVILGRLLVPGHGMSLAGSYEAMAHIWCGLVLALAIWPPEGNRLLRVWAIIALSLASAVETALFLTRAK